MVRAPADMNGPPPGVSVIVPCRDAACWLDETIRSVRAQTYHDWELIVIDDASVDASGAIALRHAADDPRVRVERLERAAGGAGARNRGLDVARGRYVAFLDADDMWRPEKLAMQLELMRSRDSMFSYTAYEKANAAGELSGRVFVPPMQIDYTSLLRTCVIGCSTVMLDRELLGSRRMPDLRRSHDYALWLEVLREGVKAVGLAQPLTIYRERPGSLSANKLAKYAAAWHIYRVRERLDLATTLRCMLSYAMHGVRKRII